MPTQLAQGVIGDAYAIFLGQAQSPTGKTDTPQRKRYGVAKQLALGKGHSSFENEAGTKTRLGSGRKQIARVGKHVGRLGVPTLKTLISNGIQAA